MLPHKIQSVIDKDSLNNPHEIFSNHDLMPYIFSFLSYLDLSNVKLVCREFNLFVRQTIENCLIKAEFSDVERITFHKSPSYIQKIIIKWLHENKDLNRVKKLLKALSLSYKERIHFLFPNDSNFSHRITSPCKNDRFSDAGVTLISLDLLPSLPSTVDNEFVVCTKFGIIAISYGLLTHNDINLFRHSGHSPGTHDNLGELLCLNGIIALQEKLITPKQAAYISDLKALLSTNGLKALREGLITPNQACGFYRSGSYFGPYDNLQKLFSDDRSFLLKEKIITSEQAAYLDDNNPLWSITPAEVGLFKEGIISLDNYPGKKIIEATELLGCLKDMVKPMVKSVICKGLVTIEQLGKMKSPRSILSEIGVQALSEGLITGLQATRISDLKNLLSKNGFTALREGLIIIEQAQRVKSLSILTPENCLQALREGLITVEDAIYHYSVYISGNYDNLSVLLNNIGLIALRKKLISPREAAFIPELNILLDEKNPDIIKAMERGLIKPSDFKSDGKYSSWRNIPSQNIKIFTQQLLSSYKPPFENNKITNQAATTIQSQCRSMIARRKLSLFKDMRIIMQKGNVHTLEELNKIKVRIESCKLQEASRSLARLKPAAPSAPNLEHSGCKLL